MSEITDPISRSAAKNPVESLLRAINEEANDAHCKCGNLLTAAENFQLGRHGGLMWAYYAVAHAALDSLPAAGRWEKAVEEIDDLRCKLYGEGDVAGEGALHTALAILDKHRISNSGHAAQPPC
jgi:hypothetical protein